MEDDLAHIFREFGKIFFLHSEPGHLLDPHPETAGGGEAFVVRGCLIVDDEVVLLKPLCDQRPLTVPNPQTPPSGRRVPCARD